MSELGLNMEVEPPKRPNTEKKGRGAVVLAVLVFIGVIGFIGVLLVRQFLGGGGRTTRGRATARSSSRCRTVRRSRRSAQR